MPAQSLKNKGVLNSFHRLSHKEKVNMPDKSGKLSLHNNNILPGGDF